MVRLDQANELQEVLLFVTFRYKFDLLTPQASLFL